MILVSSIPKLDELGIRYLISDRHAYLRLATFDANAGGLARIDWELLQLREFKRDLEHPERFDRYQAEALVYRHLPCAGLVGIACYNPRQKSLLEKHLCERDVQLKLHVRKGMFF